MAVEGVYPSVLLSLPRLPDPEFEKALAQVRVYGVCACVCGCVCVRVYGVRVCVCVCVFYRPRCRQGHMGPGPGS